MTHIVTYGGGTNSVALLLCMIAKREPPPHAILMADTKAEHPRTYLYRDQFSAFIQQHGYPPITTVHRRTRGKLADESLEQQCLRLGVLPAVAYGWKTCSQKYKIEPQDKWMNNDPMCQMAWAAGRKVTKIIGYDFGEIKRASFGEDEKYIRRYPLIEWELNRDACVAVIRQVGLPLPGKSSCFFCPHMKKDEIIKLKTEYPDLLSRALNLELSGMRKTTKVKGLGRTFSWTSITQDPTIQVAIDPYDEEPCGCYDG